MFKTQVISLFIIFILLSIPLSTGENRIHTVQTWYVDKSNNVGPWDGSLLHPFTKIQTAIDHADPYDIIIVSNGIYHENLSIDKPLTLQNKHTHQPIIDGDYNQYIITILHAEVTIKGFSIRNSSGVQGSCGIFCNASILRISQCRFSQTRTGVFIQNNTDITISESFFYINGEGIWIERSQQIKLKNNTFIHNGLGLHIENSDNLGILDCYATVNGIGFYIIQSNNIEINKCATFNNNDNQGGIFLEKCHNILINDSIISHNGFGIKTSNSDKINIIHSTFSYNTHAGLLNTDLSKDIFVSYCELTKNLRISIYNKESSITLRNNNIYNSLCGIYSEDGTCYAMNNWWGSIFGPSFFERKNRDNIKQIESNVSFIPWEYHQINMTGASWEKTDRCQHIQLNNSLQKNISFNEIDSDNDGIFDSWEEKYGYDPYSSDPHTFLDPDEDGLNNIEECYMYSFGSNPFYKDIFLEFDWMECKTSETESNKPNNEYIQKAVELFAKHNITLHIDVGGLGGGEQIPYAANFSFANLRDYYWSYFLHNDLNNPRKGIFHYGLICDYGPACGFSFIGWDNLDGFCISADIIKNNHEIDYSRQRFIMGASIHELGHTLGLTVDDHGGNDNKIATLPFSIQWFKYLTYPSCMNYFYTYFILGFSDGSHGPGDFDDWSHMDFSFFKNTHFNIPEKYKTF